MHAAAGIAAFAIPFALVMIMWRGTADSWRETWLIAATYGLIMLAAAALVGLLVSVSLLMTYATS